MRADRGSRTCRFGTARIIDAPRRVPAAVADSGRVQGGTRFRHPLRQGGEGDRGAGEGDGRGDRESECRCGDGGRGRRKGPPTLSEYPGAVILTAEEGFWRLTASRS